MTGNWIKLRKSLRSDPRVLALCAKLGKSKAEIIGALCLMWFIADDHGEKLPSVTRALLSSEIGVSGLAENLPECWLADAPDGLVFPDYEAHNGSTAKARALSSKRVERFRNGASVSKPLPEKSRVDKKETTLSADADGAGKKFVYPEDFEKFWSFYPRASGKGAAYKVWKRLSADDRLKAIDRAEWVQGCYEALDPHGDRIQFCKHAATWLNARGWEDADSEVELMARGR